MAAITREMVEQWLIELRSEQLRRLSESSAILGRIEECEMLLQVLDKEEGAETPPSPTLVEVDEAK